MGHGRQTIGDEVSGKVVRSVLRNRGIVRELRAWLIYCGIVAVAAVFQAVFFHLASGLAGLAACCVFAGLVVANLASVRTAKVTLWDGALVWGSGAHARVDLEQVVAVRLLNRDWRRLNDSIEFVTSDAESRSRSLPLSMYEPAEVIGLFLETLEVQPGVSIDPTVVAESTRLLTVGERRFDERWRPVARPAVAVGLGLAAVALGCSAMLLQ